MCPPQRMQQGQDCADCLLAGAHFEGNQALDTFINDLPFILMAGTY